MRKEFRRVQYNAQGQKQCTSCLEYKDLSAFHKFSAAPDGLKQSCKRCVKEYDTIRNAADLKHPPKRVEGKLNCRFCNKYFDENQMGAGNTYCETCKKTIASAKNFKKYGITLEIYEQMLKEQNYGCKICGKEETTFRRRLSIDHDHACCPGQGSCGKCVRGLLCHHCNAALGNVYDNVDTLKKLIAYLEK